MIDFNKLLDLYVKSIINNNNMSNLGIVNKTDDICKNFILWINYKMKDIYSLLSTENETKENIENLYNYLI